MDLRRRACHSREGRGGGEGGMGLSRCVYETIRCFPRQSTRPEDLHVPGTKLLNYYVCATYSAPRVRRLIKLIGTTSTLVTSPAYEKEFCAWCPRGRGEEQCRYCTLVLRHVCLLGCRRLVTLAVSGCLKSTIYNLASNTDISIIL